MSEKEKLIMQKGVPQNMDITSIKSILHYLSNEILPSKFETAQQPEPNTIQMGFRGINNLSWIEVSWQADCARIIKIDKPDKIGSESTLAKQLSHGLKYMALVEIIQDKFERVIKFAFAKKPGDEVIKYLIFELMGKHSNIFYLDKHLKIIAAGKQVKSTQSSHRTISTGTLYQEPPVKFKKEPNEKESYITWKENLLSLEDSLKNSLIKSYQGVSPILTEQIQYLANLEVMNQNVALIDDIYLKKIFDIWNIWINRFKNNKFNFSIFNNYFYCVWFSKFELKDDNLIDLSKGLDKYYNQYLKLKKINILISKVDNLLFKQFNLEKNNFDIQNKLLKNSENHKDLKNKADNIFLKPNFEKVDIVEAEKLYKQSKKLKRAKDQIKERLHFHKNRLYRLEEFKALLDNLNSLSIGTLKIKIDLLEELKEEISREYSLSRRNKKVRKNSPKNLDSSPIEIHSPGGLIIQIGRNMRQNDLISFKFSKKQDLWFHAQESPGSHVVLKTSSKIPTDQDIQIAADIAAFSCKGRENIKVPVNVVKIKDLQKISKAGLGCVSFKNSTIMWGNPTRGKDYIKNNI